MKHSLEGSEKHVPECILTTANFVLDIVVAQYPNLCGYVAKLSVAFRRQSYQRGWFVRLIELLTMKTQSRLNWKCFGDDDMIYSLLYGAFKQVESGMLDIKSYWKLFAVAHPYNKVDLDFFNMDSNFNHTQKISPRHTPYNYILHLLSLSDQELSLIETITRFTHERYHQFVLFGVQLYGITEFELVRLIHLLPQSYLRTMFPIFGVVKIGVSTKFVDVICTRLNRQDPELLHSDVNLRNSAIPNLLNFLCRFPQLCHQFIEEDFAIRKLIRTKQIEILEKILAECSPAGFVKFAELYGGEFTVAELQKVVPYSQLSRFNRTPCYWTPLLLASFGDEYFAQFPEFDDFMFELFDSANLVYLHSDNEKQLCKSLMFTKKMAQFCKQQLPNWFQEILNK